MPHFTTQQPLVRTVPLFEGRLAAAVPTELVVEPSPADREPIDYTLTMTLDVVAGRLQCTRLCVLRREGGPAVTSENLRRIPIGMYVQLAAMELGIVRELVATPGVVDAMEEVEWTPPPTDFAAGGMTDEALQQVSRIYRWSVATGDRPYGVLEREFGIPRAKAARWIQTARRRGYLGEE